MEDELGKIPQLKKFKIVREEEERLGCEVGSVFAEFRDKKGAELCIKMLKGRPYDGREIRVQYVDEKLYGEQLQLEQ